MRTRVTLNMMSPTRNTSYFVGRSVGMFGLNCNHLSICCRLVGLLDGSAKRPVAKPVLGREHLLIGDEAHQDGADGHTKHSDEHAGDEIRQEAREYQGRNEAGQRVALGVSKHQVGEENCDQWDENL